MPNAPEMNDVVAKKSKVRSITLPPNLLFKPAVTVIKLEMSRGSVNSFNIRRNISPGYEINRIWSADNLNGLKEKPEEKNIFFFLIILAHQLNLL